MQKYQKIGTILAVIGICSSIILTVAGHPPYVIDMSKSGFSVDCNDSVLGFGEIDPKFIVMTNHGAKNDREAGYMITNQVVDLGARLICAQGSVPENPQALFDAVKRQIDMGLPIEEEQNYRLIMTRAAFKFQWPWKQ